MKNKTAKIFGMAALAMALTIGTMPVGTLSVSAANDIPVQDESEDSVSMNTESGLTKLSTPTGARWDGWTRRWNPVPEGVEWYTFQLVKDGKHAGEEGRNRNGDESYAAHTPLAITSISPLSARTFTAYLPFPPLTKVLLRSILSKSVS